MAATLTATYNSISATIDLAYNLDGIASAYVCWSSTETTDYSSLLSAGDYSTVYSSSGTYSDRLELSAGQTRYYYFIKIYENDLIVSGSYTTQTNIGGLPTVSDLTASIVVEGVKCRFTVPAGIQTDSTIQWQRTTTDPAEGTPVWTTFATTDLLGQEVE